MPSNAYLLRAVIFAGCLVSLAACGTSEPNRAAGGAGVGAGTGAVVGAIAGPPGAAVGAVVGAGVGAASGAATTPKQVNLGKPVWDNNMHVGSVSNSQTP